MNEGRNVESTAHRGPATNEREIAWIAAHPDRARAWSESSRISTLAMATTLALGLAVHLVGYMVGTGAIGLPDWAPPDLVATLVSNLGIVLWTSVVLVVFLEILPNRTHRKARRAMARAADVLRDRGEAVPAELLEADEPSATDGEAHRDRTLEAVLDRLTSIEHRLANPRD